jgi:hypothetical protein
MTSGRVYSNVTPNNKSCHKSVSFKPGIYDPPQHASNLLLLREALRKSWFQTVTLVVEVIIRHDGLAKVFLLAGLESV